MKDNKQLGQRLCAQLTLKHFGFPIVILGSGLIAGRSVLCALGIDTSARKRILAWQVGMPDCQDDWSKLLNQVSQQGAKIQQACLIVTSGSRELSAEVASLCGSTKMVQICVQAKIRAIENKLPTEIRKRYRLKLEDAYNQDSYIIATQRLGTLYHQFVRICPPAANELIADIESTVRLHELGIRGRLRRVLQTTNTIHMIISCMGGSYQKAQLPPAQLQNWLDSSISESERRVVSVPGPRQISKLRRPAINIAYGA